jgi:hypothetical protein
VATAVQLNLTVDEKGALTGFERFKTGVKASMSAIAAEFKNFGAQSQQLGAQAEAAGQKAQSAFRGIQSETLKSRIAERILLQDLGIELPGALSKVIAKSQALGPILAGAFNVAILTTAISALSGIGNKIVEVTQEMAGYTATVKQMEQATIQASRQAFITPGTVDIAVAHTNELNKKIEELERKKKQVEDLQQRALTQNPFSQDSGYGEERSLTEQENKALQEQKQIQDQIIELESQRNQLTEHRTGLVKEENKALEQQNKVLQQAKREATLAGLQGFAKLNAEKQFASQDITDPEVLAANERKFVAESGALARQNAQATLALRHQVTDETLADELKIREDEKFSIKELDNLRSQSLITRQDYEQRAVLIHQQATNKLKTLDLEVQKVHQQTEDFVLQQDIQSLTGEEKLYAERNLKIKQLEDAKKGIIAASNGQTTSLIAAKLSEISQKEIAITKLTQEEVDKLRKGEAEKTALLLEQSAEETRNAETAAALATIPPWQRAYAQIVIESNKRIQQIDQQERSQLAKYKQGSDEYAALSKEADAKRAQVHAETDEKIIQENKRMADQLGSELESVFNDIGSGNIGKRILQNMEKLFFQILAQWILSMGVMKSQAGSILGSVVFGPGSTGANIFGGGGNPFGGLLGGGLFGGGGTPPFVPPGISGGSPTAGGTATGAPASFANTGQLFGSSLGNIFGQGSTTAATINGAATSSSTATTASALGLGAFFGQSPALTSVVAPSGPLNTTSLSDVLGGAIAGDSSAGAATASPSRSGGLLGLGKLLSPNGLLGVGALASSLLGRLGGTTGSIGGTLLALGLTGKLSGIVSALFGTIGATGAAAVLGGGIGGLLGFGLGQNFGSGIGALSGAGSGALSGLLIGGPIGALVGGLIGLLGGIFGGIFGGSKRKKQANSFVDSTVLPDIKKIVDAYENFQLDFAGANKQLDDLDTQAKAELGKLKGEGKSIFGKRVQPAIDDAKKEIKKFEDERQRRSSLTFGPPQFHDGGFVSSAFSSFVNRPGELMAVLKHGEFVVNPQSTSRNLQTLERINSGGTISGDMHFYAPLIQAQRVDEAWLRNGGAQQILDALRRAKYEGLR